MAKKKTTPTKPKNWKWQKLAISPKARKIVGHYAVEHEISFAKAINELLENSDKLKKVPN